MNKERFQRVKEIFDHAAQLDASQVSVFLEKECAGDSTLRTEVESLLRENDSNSLFEWEKNNLVGKLANATKDAVDPMVGRQIDAYVIERRIGEGGMGTVYLASRQEGYEQQVAIKLTKPGITSEEVLRRFRGEMQFLAALGRHPNIAGLMDGGSTDDGLHYLVMEYIDGVRIDEYCDKHQLSIRQRLELFLDVCAAVQFAHQNTVIHRDIKPSNILITSEGTAKLIDFGIAKLNSPEMAEGNVDVTQTLFRALTPDYASPEQAVGEPLTVATDVYSLGIVLYELLTGHRPYVIETTNPAAIAQKIRQQQPATPSAAVSRNTTIVRGNVSETIDPEGVSRRRNTSLPKLRREISGDLDNVVLKALRKEPERRYPSIEQMAGDIRRYLHGLPVSARKDTLGYRFGKFVRRNRAAVAATALVLVSLIAGIVGTSTQWIRATQKAAEAKAEAEEKSEIFNFFVLDMLGAAHPNARAPDTTVIEVLGDAAETVNDRFGSRPNVASVVHDTLGQSFLGLGDYRASREHLERALELRKTLGEENSEETLNTMTVLGDALDCEGRLEDAESVLREAVDLGTQSFGTRNRYTLNAMTKLGETLQSRKKHDEAQNILNQAIDLLGDEFGPDDRARQSALTSLAASYAAQGKTENSEPILNEILAARRASGAKSPELLNALNQLGGLYYQRHEFEKAAPYFREIIELAKVFPDGHPSLGTFHGNYGACLGKMGRPKEAEEHMLKSYEINRDGLGQDHYNTEFRLKNMHGFYWHYKEVEKATRYHRLYITSRLRKSKYDDSSKSTPIYWIDFLQSKLSDHGQTLDLDELLQELVAYPNEVTIDDPIRARYLGNLGRVLAHYGRSEQAIESFSECLDIHRQLGSDADDTEWISEELAKLHTPGNSSDEEPEQ